jgi:sphingomyelin phosphodiesterase 2
MQDLPDEINLITLNCWGLKYISKLRRERLAEIGRQLSIASPQPHIVALQECWTQEDYQSIRRQTRFILPYGKFYHSAALGGGLAILSRWPIEESSMYRYPLNGRPTAFWRGDWYVGKGVACAKIRYGPAAKQVIEVFNTHTHAPYEGGKPNDSYLCHRTAQSWEMAKLLRGAAERGHLVLAMGDFNMIPMSLEHQLVTALAPVRDVWRVLHPDSSWGPSHHPAEEARRRPIPTAEFNIQENGAASDGPYNTWRWTKSQQKLLGPGRPPVTVPPDTPGMSILFSSTLSVTDFLRPPWQAAGLHLCWLG